jgi:hypothetical protein
MKHVDMCGLLWALALAGIATSGCQSEPRGLGLPADDGGINPGDGGGGGGSQDPGDDGGGGGDDGGGDDGGDGEPKFDVAASDLSGPSGDQETACEKVDLLFVIDDSQSMEDEQAHLIASFPDFIETMRQVLVDVDYHLGITTSDAYVCNPAPCNVPGALVTDTCGDNSSASTCGPYADADSYMTDADDLEGNFACAAQVGTGGDFDEKPMYAMGQAVTTQIAPGACNEGFLRDDALLVIVVITDEEDDDEFECNHFPGSPGGPSEWFDTIVQAKGGIESNAVVLSLVGLPPPDDCPPKVCGVQNTESDAEIASRILEFTNMFTYSFVGPICAENYDSFFEEAVAVIETACDEFSPPG